MKFNESLPTFICRQITRIKIDQNKGIADDDNIVKPNFKKYLKLFLINKYPFIFRYKTNKEFNKEKNKIKPEDLIKLNSNLLDSYETFAFDIFDTIIYREIPPESIKDLVSKYISKLSNTDYLKIRNLRFESEIEIGQRNIKKGLDSDNKYDELLNLWLQKLKEKFPLSKFPSKESIKDHELFLEKESQFTKQSIVDFLKLLKEKKKKIIFISDFYFDSKIIFSFLKNLKCDQFFDEGYCSCEYLLTKRSGRLYKKLIDDKKINPSETLMIGDNPIGDCVSSKKYNIKSFLIYDPDQKYQNYKIELVENLRKQNVFFEGATLKELIDEKIPKNRDYDYNLGIFLAPLYISFVEKIINYCQKNDIKKIYFLSREGKIFLNIFNKINIDNNLHAQYLVVSRKSTFLLSINELSTCELDRIWKQYNNQTPKQLLRNLNLSKHLLSVFKKYGIAAKEIIDQDYNYKKLNIIFSDPEFKKTFQRTKENQLKYFNQYIKTIGLDKDKKIALVDIGWKGSIQNNLFKIINKKEIHGLYLGCFKEVNKDISKNKKEGLIVDEKNSNWYEKNLFKNGPLFEMSTTPNEGSCFKYNMNGPITKQYNSEKETYQKFFSKTQTGIYDYVDLYSKNKEIIGLDPKNSHHFLLDQIIRFILFPNNKDAKSFLRYSHVESFGVNEISKFNYKFRWNYIFSDMNPIHIYKRIKINFFNQFWVNGHLKRTSIPLINLLFNITH